MKRTERHHLKENELAHRISAARDYIESRQSSIAKLAILVVVLAVIVGGFAIYRRQAASQGDQLLAEAMVALNAPVVPAGTQGSEGLPAAAQLGAAGTFSTEAAKLNAAVPKLQAAADGHPDTRAGITARYHLAGAFASLGKTTEATAAFDEVVRRAGADSLYGRMARLGKADVQARSGQLDAAIATWKELTTQAADDVPVDAILMDLARAYLQKGDTQEARKTFTQIVDQHADSPYSTDARRELDNLKG
jgi:tetratricopeptide (TPR) repeat protein